MPLPDCIVAVGEGDATHSPIYRRNTSKDGYPTLEGVATLYELFSKSVEKYADLPALGHRVVQDGKAGDFQFMTYKEAGALVGQIASALAAHGLKRQARVGVYGANTEEWMIAMQACNRMSYECVPLYDSLGENAIEFIVRHSEAVAVFVVASKAAKLAQAVDHLQAGGDHHLKHVIFWGGDAPAETVEALKAHGLTVQSWKEALAAGTAAPAEPVPPTADDFSTIMYTSGTTGDPKGVLLKHSAIVAAVCNVVQYTKLWGTEFGPGDSMLSYLPLAHIFDRVAEEMFLYLGGSIGYWQGDTTKLVDDIGALKPSMFIGVPRIFDRIYTAVTGQIDKAGGVKKFLFNWGFTRKLFFMKQGTSVDNASPFFDKLVFSKVKARLGGRVKLIVSGGAPLAPHVEEFLRVTMCAPVAQGYGLTECCAGANIALADSWDQFATNGPPLSCIEMRFESVPEMNYDATDKEAPSGEVLLRGPCLFTGYYKQADKTEEVLDADGWFHTGDIGTLTAAGALKIVDRKKNIFKLSQGEYIAVEKLEATYLKASPVEQVWVYGDSYQAKLVAVVVPKKHALEDWAKAAGKSGSFKELCADPAAKAWTVKELVATGKADKLKGFELVAAVHLEPEPFSVEADLMTPTFKLKRPQLKKAYQADLDKMYADLAAAPASKRE
ncbi:MAG: hypothetical protein J3K34DRAFT_416911 [Monoraphidium minutum]|nr:MAG: hypothetical protein J3K34DRAFT_416911 [Monoraphidium minutum]